MCGWVKTDLECSSNRLNQEEANEVRTTGGSEERNGVSRATVPSPLTLTQLNLLNSCLTPPATFFRRLGRSSVRSALNLWTSSAPPRSTQGQPTLVFNHIPPLLHHFPGMSHLAPSTSSLQSTERIGQGSIRGESKWPRYASPVVLIGLRVNMTRGKQFTHSVDPHSRQ